MRASFKIKINLTSYFVYIGLLAALIFLLYMGGKVRGATYEVFDVFNKTVITPFHVLALFLISTVVGFRYDVGTDWSGYKDWFEYYKVVPWESLNKLNFEPGFLFLNYFLASFGFSYTIMFFSVALISWFFLFKGLAAKFLPLFIFFVFVDEYFFWSMNGIRQFVAISIFIFSIRFIIQKNLKKYSASILIASLFHTSALILLPFFFIPWEKIYKVGVWFFMFIISLFLANTSLILNSVENVLKVVGNFVPILSVYLEYFENGRFEASITEIGLGFYFRVIIASLIFYYSRYVVEKYPSTKIFFLLFFIGSILYNMFYMFPLIGRINLYFIFARTISLALVVYYLWTEKKHRPVAIGICALYFILFLVTINNSSNDCCPYEFRI